MTATEGKAIKNSFSTACLE